MNKSDLVKNISLQIDSIKKNDIVWTCTNSFVASSNCALYCGASIDLIDIDPKLLFKPIFSPPQAKNFDILHVKIFQEKLENSRTYFRYGRKKSFQTKKNLTHTQCCFFRL